MFPLAYSVRKYTIMDEQTFLMDGFKIRNWQKVGKSVFHQPLSFGQIYPLRSLKNSNMVKIGKISQPPVEVGNFMNLGNFER